MDEQQVQQLLMMTQSMSPTERAMFIAALQKAMTEQQQGQQQQPQQQSPIKMGDIVRVGRKILGSGGGASQVGNVAANSAPLSEAGMAASQEALGPLADMGLSSSSPASGAMAQMGGVPAGDTVAATGNFMSTPLQSLGGYTPTQGLGAIQAAYGGYNTAKSFGKGGEGIRSGTTNLGAGIGTMLGGPPGTAIGAGIGNFVGYGLQDNGWKNNLALMASGGLVGGPALMLARDHLMRPSIKQRQQDRTNQLSKLSDDATWQNYVGGMRGADWQAAHNKELPYAGKYRTWDEYKKAGLEADNLTGVYGNMKTFGADWGKLTQEQRQAITQLAIDNDLYDSKQGDIQVTDPEKLRELAQGILTGQPMIGPAQSGIAQGGDVHTMIGPPPSSIGNKLTKLPGFKNYPGKVSGDGQMLSGYGEAKPGQAGLVNDLMLRFTPEQSAEFIKNWPKLSGGITGLTTQPTEIPGNRMMLDGTSDPANWQGQPQVLDAGTIKRRREMRGQKGYTGR